MKIVVEKPQKPKMFLWLLSQVSGGVGPRHVPIMVFIACFSGDDHSTGQCEKQKMFVDNIELEGAAVIAFDRIRPKMILKSWRRST